MSPEIDKSRLWQLAVMHILVILSTPPQNAEKKLVHRQQIHESE
ncbi:conserved protein of unknown function [Limnospira indica PCC 8005]|uniref:Uncharacterized protein n=1 Tax=Limnospira indica PCC 8005 TaxID=376219 RepID=A0A9P1KHH5_9CYAN|nr:conserved protein of unknown function [Limnospira indica PCC 8005]